MRVGTAGDVGVASFVAVGFGDDPATGAGVVFADSVVVAANVPALSTTAGVAASLGCVDASVGDAIVSAAARRVSVLVPSGALSEPHAPSQRAIHAIAMVLTGNVMIVAFVNDECKSLPEYHYLA